MSRREGGGREGGGREGGKGRGGREGGREIEGGRGENIILCAPTGQSVLFLPCSLLFEPQEDHHHVHSQLFLHCSRF